VLFLTKWFGVTGSDAERSLVREQSVIEEIVERDLTRFASGEEHSTCYVEHDRPATSR
jgi:hypothetical protein